MAYITNEKMVTFKNKLKEYKKLHKIYIITCILKRNTIAVFAKSSITKPDK